MAATRRVQLPLLLLAAAALLLPFLRHARNRLLSGDPVAFPAALALAGPWSTATLAAGCLLLLAPVARPETAWARWLGLLGAGIALAAAAALAADAAAHLAAGALPSARTSFGAGYWGFAAALLLLGSDTARRLRPGPLAGAAALLLLFGPLAALLIAGTLAPLSLLREYAAHRGEFDAALLRHILLVLGGLFPALLVGVPLGVAAARRRSVRRIAFPVLNLLQTIPSIALFGLLIGPLSALGLGGVGIVPAIIALVLYSLLPIVRNTEEGLLGVPPATVQAARGMGMSAAQVFLRVEAALALPVLLSGLRITVVQAIGLAAVSALIGAGGLGAIIFQGLFANALDLVVLGALPVIALAVAADLLFGALAATARARLGMQS